METWESGQPVTRATKWAKHWIKLDSYSRFASSEFSISIKPLRLFLSLFNSRFARIMLVGFGLHPQNYLFEVFAKCGLSKRTPFVAGFCWYDCLEAITMEITTTMEASGGVCQTAVSTRQQLIKLPDTKTGANGGQAGERGEENECEMSHFTLLFCYFFAFYPLQSSESFWGALLGADWQTVQEAVLPAALSAGDTYLNTAWGVCQIFFFLLETRLY